jgi:hypothetical protein
MTDMTMPTYRWALSGEKLMMTTWNGDAQVIYLVEPSTHPQTGYVSWLVHRKVSGVSQDMVVGERLTVAEAKALAETDAEMPL